MTDRWTDMHTDRWRKSDRQTNLHRERKSRQTGTCRETDRFKDTYRPRLTDRETCREAEKGRHVDRLAFKWTNEQMQAD